MAKALLEKHLKAIELRFQGRSYSQIKQELQVSKGSLSLWLRKYPLSEERLRELRDWNQQRIERFRNTMRAKRESRLRGIYEKARRRFLPLTKRELLISGLFLYWGEGSKTGYATTSLSNTNPKVVKFFLYWLVNVLKVPREKILVRLHLYKDMNPEKEITFWSRELGITAERFRKPYIKKTTLRGLTYKGFGHGTCNLIVWGRDLIEEILMGIDAIGDEYIRRLK